MPGQPPQRLRETLAGARAADVPWTTAWKVGCQAALLGVRTTDRREWAQALSATREAWRSAYFREPGAGWSLDRPTAD